MPYNEENKIKYFGNTLPVCPYCDEKCDVYSSKMNEFEKWEKICDSCGKHFICEVSYQYETKPISDSSTD